MTNRRALLSTAAHGAAARLLLHARPRATDLTSLSLGEASAMVWRKEVSPVELTHACLARIEHFDPSLNSFITVTGEMALQQAREAEAEIAKGNWRGPLHGIPIALKDLIDTAGVRTTAASALFQNRMPREDAEVVRRLKAAGAVMLGKLNMHEFAYGGSSVTSFFGPVHNPWNLDRIAGGSSGGSAAAVAAGLCFAALGSDTGGSIRQPSAYCGIAGLKPTYGRVSTRGVIPLAWSLDHIGPMCRTVSDTAIMLQVIAGYDLRDTASADMPVPDYVKALESKVSTLRLGTPRAVFYENLAPEIETAVNRAIEVLRKLTASVKDVHLPEYGTLPITAAEAWAYHAPSMTKTSQVYQIQTRNRLEQAAKVTAETYIHARRELDRLRRAIGGSFVEVDLLITPTTPIPPFTIAECTPLEPSPPMSLRNTSRFNVYGLPTISVPCGFTRSGLPIGLQISGPHFGEPALLALAYAYERATEWHTRRPNVKLKGQ